MVVLVVDDDESVQNSLTDILRAEDCQVLTARNGEDALALLKKLEQPPSLILVDLVMPRMDGDTFLRKKAELATMSKVPVLVLTAGKANVNAPDVIGLLRKPFDLDDLAPYLRPAP